MSASLLMRTLSGAYRTARFFPKMHDVVGAAKIAISDVPLSAIERSNAKRRVRMSGIDIDVHKHRFMLGGYQYVLDLHQRAGAAFHTGDYVCCSVSDVRYRVQTLEELIILHEVYVQRTYNVSAPLDQIVVWDIGLNVGISALYFARRGFHVFGCEPFSKTVDVARYNISLNPTLSSKISIHGVGVGGYSRDMQVPYSKEWKGNVSTAGRKRNIVRSNISSVEDVRIVDAANMLNVLMEEYPSRPVIAKVDCEGSEYEIIERLAEADMLRLLYAMIVEWHGHGSTSLVHALCDSGFCVSCIDDPQEDAGYIYAVNTFKSDA